MMGLSLFRLLIRLVPMGSEAIGKDIETVSKMTDEELVSAFILAEQSDHNFVDILWTKSGGGYRSEYFELLRNEIHKRSLEGQVAAARHISIKQLVQSTLILLVMFAILLAIVHFVLHAF